MAFYISLDSHDFILENEKEDKKHFTSAESIVSKI